MLPDAVQEQLAVHVGAALAARPVSLPRARDDTLIDAARRRLAGART
jgi:hypothetical protein